MQGLEHLHVEIVGEGRVAADPEHRHGPLHQTEFLDRLQGTAHGHGLPTSGTEVMGPHVDEGGHEVADQAGGHLRRPVGGHEFAHLGTTRSIRCRSTLTSRSGAIPKPEPSRLRPPMKCTGVRPRTARRTSSII